MHHVRGVELGTAPCTMLNAITRKPAYANRAIFQTWNSIILGSFSFDFFKISTLSFFPPIILSIINTPSLCTFLLKEICTKIRNENNFSKIYTKLSFFRMKFQQYDRCPILIASIPPLISNPLLHRGEVSNGWKPGRREEGWTERCTRHGRILRDKGWNPIFIGSKVGGRFSWTATTNNDDVSERIVASRANVPRGLIKVMHQNAPTVPPSIPCPLLHLHNDSRLPAVLHCVTGGGGSCWILPSDWVKRVNRAYIDGSIYFLSNPRWSFLYLQYNPCYWNGTNNECVSFQKLGRKNSMDDWEENRFCVKKSYSICILVSFSSV